MASLKFTSAAHWTAVESHLASAHGERFAFALTRLLYDGPAGPVLEVRDVVLIADSEVVAADDGWSVTDEALDRVHNKAAGTMSGLVEFHNHHSGPPAFSRTDQRGLGPMATYVVDLLDRPYMAAVWADGRVHAEWWRRSVSGALEHGNVRTIVVLGDQLQVLNAAPLDEERFARQVPLLGEDAQGAMSRLRIALVGLGGTGSQVALGLAHLGVRDVLLLDDDVIDESNLNRTVTAGHADVGDPKASVARRRMLLVDPNSQAVASVGIRPDDDCSALWNVDLIVGCVDNDGPRQLLNQFAVAARIPYMDVATGVDDSGGPVAVGGRVIWVLPAGPCLACVDELDSVEVAQWAKSDGQRELDRLHGYGSGAESPSVVYLNGLVANAALTELAAWLAGVRRPAAWLDVDLVGSCSAPGCRVAPRAMSRPRQGCIECDRWPSADQAVAG